MGDGIFGFFIGLLLIPFALILIWKNERKIVKYHKVIVQARADLKSDVKAPLEENELCLVHTKGCSVNEEVLEDKEFGVQVANSYRLNRKVEMFQWVET